jgi:hypothetical protein
MARTGADMAEAELVQDLAHRALVIGDPEALGDEVLQVDPPPAHNPVHRPIGSGLDEVGQLDLLLGREAGRVTLGPSVLEPLWAVLVEAVNPVTQRLAIHAADARRLRSAHPVQPRGQGQQAPPLIHMLRPGREPPKLTGREVRPDPHSCRQGTDPPRHQGIRSRPVRKAP